MARKGPGRSLSDRDQIVPLIYGGIQETGRRAGTEKNVPAIVGMGKAAELAQKELQSRMDYYGL